MLWLPFLSLLQTHEGEGSEKWHGMKSCCFLLFGVFLSWKASDCDKGYESWDVQPPHLVLRSRRRHSGKSNHSVWFVLLNNEKHPYKAPQNQNLLVAGISFSLNQNKWSLIGFFGGNKSLLPKPDFCFCGTWSWGRIEGERKRFILCFYPCFLCSGICFHWDVGAPRNVFLWLWLVHCKTQPSLAISLFGCCFFNQQIFF